MNVNVLRLDHRLKRDTRITTHVCLTARAFGASKIYLAGERDNKLMENVRDTASRFGGNFEIEYAEGYMRVINKMLVVCKCNYGISVSLIMLLYLRALLYDIAAVAYLPEEVLARVGTELDLVGSARGHKEDFSTKSLAYGCGVALCYLVCKHGLNREGLSVRDHRADLVERDYILKCLVGQTGVHKQRTVAADEYLPEYLDPLDRI